MASLASRKSAGIGTTASRQRPESARASSRPRSQLSPTNHSSPRLMVRYLLFPLELAAHLPAHSSILRLPHTLRILARTVTRARIQPQFIKGATIYATVRARARSSPPHPPLLRSYHTGSQRLQRNRQPRLLGRRQAHVALRRAHDQHGGLLERQLQHLQTRPRGVVRRARGGRRALRGRGVAPRLRRGGDRLLHRRRRRGARRRPSPLARPLVLCLLSVQ